MNFALSKLSIYYVCKYKNRYIKKKQIKTLEPVCNTGFELPDIDI